jgi:hypothetical protein
MKRWEPYGATRQAIRNLRGGTIAPVSLASADFDEAQFVKRLSRYGSRNFAPYYFIVKMQVLYRNATYFLNHPASTSFRIMWGRMVSCAAVAYRRPGGRLTIGRRLPTFNATYFT